MSVSMLASLQLGPDTDNTTQHPQLVQHQQHEKVHLNPGFRPLFHGSAISQLRVEVFGQLVLLKQKQVLTLRTAATP